MKKMFAFLMALCLMLTAFAAVAEGKSRVMQDEKPPVLVPVNGAVAQIVDADGNVLAKVTAEDQLKLTDVHQRDSESMQDVSDRLKTAYNELMNNVHFSDVQSSKNYKNLKEEIDSKLAGAEFNAHDIALFEIFDTKVLGEFAGLVADGTMIEFTIKPEGMAGTSLLVGFSASGKEWGLLDYAVANPDGTLTLRIPSNGTVSIMPSCDIRSTNTYYYEYTTEDYNYETQTFTPSVTGKPVPSIVTTVDGSGKQVIAKIKVPGASTVPVYDNDAMIITPVAESVYVMDVTTHEHLQWSYDSILNAANLGQLQSGFAAEIDAALSNAGFGHLDHTQMVVRDLFEVSCYGSVLDALYNDGAELEIQFALEPLTDVPLVVLFSADSRNWNVLPQENVVLEEDGTLTLTLTEVGAVAFATEKADELTQVTYQSPQ